MLLLVESWGAVRCVDGARAIVANFYEARQTERERETGKQKDGKLMISNCKWKEMNRISCDSDTAKKFS